MVSHDLDQVRRIADTVTLLDRCVVAEGAPSEALAHAEVLDMLPAGRRR
jgi:ABC-type Mn2+/Zn2+ transport system ATPase subunit